VAIFCAEAGLIETGATRAVWLVAHRGRAYAVDIKKKDLTIARQAPEFFGSGGRDRTYDQLINSQLLYR
jgi:hypothetical protein